MEKIKVLVAGCGYLGEKLTKILCDNNFMVYTLKRSSHKVHGAHPVQMDLGNIVIQDLPQVDIIFYTASPLTNSNESFQHTYIEHLENLINAYKNRPVKRFILCSSTAIYGPGHGEWMDETSPVALDCAKSKILFDAEQLTQNSGFDSIIARISSIYGPNRHHILDRIKSGHFHASADTIYSNRIYIDDCARALEHLMRIQRNEFIYNITDEYPAPINTIISWLSSKHGIPFPDIQDISQTQDEIFLSNKRVSCQRILTTGFTFQFPSFKEGFQRILKLEAPPRELDY